MKSVVLNGLKSLMTIDMPGPSVIRDDEVLVEMRSVGICGSDIHYFNEGRIGDQVIRYPFTIGHEGAGVIVEAGVKVTGLDKGDRIVIDPAMPCYRCDQCLSGRYHTCRNLKFLGCPGQNEGCLSEYISIPARSCIPIPAGFSFDLGVLVEPLSVGLYAVRLASVSESDNIGILGSGPIGISVMLAARIASKGRIYMTDLVDARLKMALEMGGDWTGNPESKDIISEIVAAEHGQLDVVFECCGRQEAIDQAIQLLKPGGKLLIAGIPSFETWRFDAHELRRKEITIINVRRQNECMKPIIDLIAAGKISPEKMLTHCFSLSNVQHAFELVAGYHDGVMKAVIHT